jgi:hypothetical protein
MPHTQLVKNLLGHMHEAVSGRLPGGVEATHVGPLPCDIAWIGKPAVLVRRAETTEPLRSSVQAVFLVMVVVMVHVLPVPVCTRLLVCVSRG